MGYLHVDRTPVERNIIIPCTTSRWYTPTRDPKNVPKVGQTKLSTTYNAAWRMRHKLMQVMMERDRAHVLGGFIQLDDAYLGGERSGGKR